LLSRLRENERIGTNQPFHRFTKKTQFRLILRFPDTSKYAYCLKKYPELKMTESAPLQRYVSMSLGGFYVWDLQQNLFWADEAFAMIMGFDPEELDAGLPVERMIPLIHEDDQPHVVQGIKNSVLSGEPFEMVYRIRRGESFAKITEVGKCYRYVDGVATLFSGVVFDSPCPTNADASNGNVPVTTLQST
jgi:PAS domain-containing protein